MKSTCTAKTIFAAVSCMVSLGASITANAQDLSPPPEPVVETTETPYLDTFSRFYVGTGGGGHFVLSDWDMGELDAESQPISPESSLLGELRLGVDFNALWGVEASLGFLPFDASAETNDGFDFAVRARRTFVPDGFWKPYAVFGLGTYLNPQPDPDGNDDNVFKPQAHVGVGISPRVSEDFRARLEARYTVSDGLDDATLPFANLLALVVGVDFLTGTETKPEPVFVPPPELPKDTDGDGLLDPDDQCPTEPEDKDGFEDEDGCPDPDNDKDGILDNVDKCPNEAETVNQFQDQDGCPDELPDTVPCKSISFNQTISFAKDEHLLTSDDIPTLNSIARTLKARTDLLQVLITGHTDHRASETYNLALSKKRATSVQKALIARGISPDRLSVDYKGETKPVTTNKSPEAMAKNRRVEFRIIKETPNAQCPNPRKSQP